MTGQGDEAAWDFKSASVSEPGATGLEIDVSVPHSARMYDYYLGGKTNYPADREAAERVISAFPQMRTVAREGRALMRRMVAYLAEEAGIRQFLDIGTGIPTSPNLHEIVQGIAPESRVVYVDNDPIVLAHARALLASREEGATAYIHADLLQPDRILNDPVLQKTLDLSRPAALVINGTLHFFPDSVDPHGIVARLVGALAPGSYVALQHATADVLPDYVSNASAGAVASAVGAFRYRTRQEFARFFDGLELVPPGIELMAQWRAEKEPQPRPPASEASGYGAVGRKN